MTALDTAAESTVAEPQPSTPRQRVKLGAPIAYGVAALTSLLVFGLTTKSGASTVFAVSSSTDALSVPNLTVPSRPVVLVCSALALALAGLATALTLQGRRRRWWLPAAFGVLLVSAILTWAGAGKDALSVQLTGLLAGALLAAIPLIFGALAGTICERSGVVNIAIEGQLLGGAFVAAVVAGGVAHASGSRTFGAYAGLFAAPLAGVLVGALLALFAVRYWVDQIVVGVVLNVLVVGLTSFLYGTLFKSNPELNQAIGLPELPIPLLGDIPLIGPVLFRHNLLVYLMYVTVIVLHIMLFKSRWGLRVRAVGEHPKAADTVGIKVNRTRVRNTILGGAVAALGGAYFTVASSLAFGKDMSAGKGFIALAAMILGRWSPKGALMAALLFGFADSMREQFFILGAPIPSQFLAMLPYIATILAVAGLVGYARPPAAEGTPYKK